MSDEQVYVVLGDAFLDVCFAETEAQVVDAHLQFMRASLELQARISGHRRPRKRRSAGSRYGDSGEVQS